MNSLKGKQDHGLQYIVFCLSIIHFKSQTQVHEHFWKIDTWRAESTIWWYWLMVKNFLKQQNTLYHCSQFFSSQL